MSSGVAMKFRLISFFLNGILFSLLYLEVDKFTLHSLPFFISIYKMAALTNFPFNPQTTAQWPFLVLAPVRCKTTVIYPFLIIVSMHCTFQNAFLFSIYSFFVLFLWARKHLPILNLLYTTEKLGAGVNLSLKPDMVCSGNYWIIG